MRERPHSHPCARCAVETPCSGTLEANPDGWPEIVCVEFDIEAREVLCNDCQELEESRGDVDPDGEDLFRDYQAELRDAAEAAQKLK